MYHCSGFGVSTVPTCVPYVLHLEGAKSSHRFFFSFIFIHIHISSADRGGVETYRRFRNEPTHHHYTCPAGDDDEDDDDDEIYFYLYMSDSGIYTSISIAKDEKKKSKKKRKEKRKRERGGSRRLVLYEAMGMGNCACLELRASFFPFPCLVL